MSARRVGLYGSSHGVKRGLLGVLDYLGPAAETDISICRGMLDCSRVDRQGCLRGVFDCMGPTMETKEVC